MDYISALAAFILGLFCILRPEVLIEEHNVMFNTKRKIVKAAGILLLCIAAFFLVLAVAGNQTLLRIVENL